MAAGDLTDIAHVGAWLKMASAQYNADAILPDLISDCSAAFVKEVGRPLLSAIYTEKRDGNGKNFMPVKNPPITAVSSLVINTLSVPLSTDGVHTGYVFDERRILLVNWWFCKGFQNVTLSYTGGFTAIPGDIRRAVTMLVAHLYRGIEHVGERSKVFEQHQQTTYDIREMPDHVRAVADRYKFRMPIY